LKRAAKARGGQLIISNAPYDSLPTSNHAATHRRANACCSSDPRQVDCLLQGICQVLPPTRRPQPQAPHLG
jgi:hypothetical protein